jgi:diphosphomevalonate decarboxylase
MFENPKLVLETTESMEPVETVWRSPSNIALVKYWGKYGDQLPRNASVSFTLSAAYTEMQLIAKDKEHDLGGIDLAFRFHGEEKPAFAQKMVKYLEQLTPIFPFLKQVKLEINTGNSFPHSAGIASSASAMSALALCLCTLEDKLFGTLKDQAKFDQKASYLARIGSGSASRSIYGHAAVWGETTLLPEAHNEWAVPYGAFLHPVFKGMHDDILIVSKDEKSVSSRAGHALMDQNPFAEPRYAQAKNHLIQIDAALRSGDLETFGRITEMEALSLHALMMTSNPSYVLMRPNSLAIIEKVRAYREDTGQQVYFTLDAGPNIHLLYPEDIITDVRAFVLSDLIPMCEEGRMIQDWVGEGPEEL